MCKPFALVLLAALAGCSSIHSTVKIESGDQFILGGEQLGPFTAELLNEGPATVTVLEVTSRGDTLLVASLDAEQSARASFSTGSAAVLANRSREDASVRAVVRGDTNLGMRYVPIGETARE